MCRQDVFYILNPDTVLFNFPVKRRQSPGIISIHQQAVDKERIGISVSELYHILSQYILSGARQTGYYFCTANLFAVVI